MKTKLPHKIISRLRSNAPARETGGWGRRYEPCSGGESEAVAYKSVCIFVQNGLAGHVELFKEITKGIFKIQHYVGRKYPLLVVYIRCGQDIKSRKQQRNFLPG